MAESLSHASEGPVEFITDVLLHASEQERVVQAEEADHVTTTSALAEQPPASIEFVLESIEELGPSQGRDQDEIRLLKRDAVIARVASLRRYRQRK